MDHDADVDLHDHVYLESCPRASGPDNAPGSTTCLDVFDSDIDLDIDLRDLALFQVNFTGP